MSTVTTTAPTFPTQRTYDRSTGELTIAVDAFPASIDDATVAVGSSRLRIRIEHDGRVYDRTETPPRSDRAFTTDGKAVYNNGVLTVTVATTRRSR
ncbi:hypothetical protein [Halopiger xanaduensis]|uniref:Hsp20/alpha crystallin family protein n=1 Tax=Halopiger xanaduensis (strain DSM 18323 / JCM 14033 / SH-6) TaxID=797210 RepID=F8DAA5_HALXS|nr:hypothetical protein [Halopiger xanaduensis]AEH38185.1 hypothetical protein Halxa_3574 [Halopiger xanaduensis SH-6]